MCCKSFDLNPFINISLSNNRVNLLASFKFSGNYSDNNQCHLYLLLCFGSKFKSHIYFWIQRFFQEPQDQNFIHDNSPSEKRITSLSTSKSWERAKRSVAGWVPKKHVPFAIELPKWRVTLGSSPRVCKIACHTKRCRSMCLLHKTTIKEKY